MNLTIIEADGLQQSFVTRYIYVKILWKEEVFKTPPSAKATSVRAKRTLLYFCSVLLPLSY